MSDSGQTYVDQCRYLARRLRLEACKTPGVPILVRLDYSDVEAVARMLECYGAVELGLAKLRGLRATRPYYRAVEHETWARRTAWILSGVLLQGVVAWLHALLAAVFG
jgi:hypothetical protein